MSLSEEEVIELGFKKIKTNLSEYKFIGVEVYQTAEHEVALYPKNVLKQYPHLKNTHGYVKRINI